MGERALRPFWIHQVVEYLLGVALIGQGLQDLEPLVPVVLGMVFVLNAAVVRGPFGAFKWLGRGAHRRLDVGVAAIALAAAAQPWIAISSTGRGSILIVVAAFGFLWWYTDWAERPARAARLAAKGSVTSESIGRSAGRTAGRSYAAIRKALKR